MSSFTDKEVRSVSQQQTSLLLHNKFVLVLGDSIQRAVYKDLVLLLQKENYLKPNQLRNKGEMSFETDCLLEGGCRNQLHNGIHYREVRQYQSDHHLVRFYFLTRIYSDYMQKIFEDIRRGLKPDVVIVNSCLWDISRYCNTWITDYKRNLNRFLKELKEVVPVETLIIWNLTMPLGEKIRGGFLVPEVEHKALQLRFDVIVANFYSGTLADAYGLDVLDLHFHFRFFLRHRMRDGVHWDALAHRKITCLLLQHAAQAWGVQLIPPPVPALPQLPRVAPKLQESKPSKKRKYNNENIPYGSCSKSLTSAWKRSQKARYFEASKMYSDYIPLPPPLPPYRHECRGYWEDFSFSPPYQFYMEQHSHSAVMRPRHSRHHFEPYNHPHRSYSRHGYRYNRY